MKAVIFAGAKISNYAFCKEYLESAHVLICCDGGLHHTKALGLMPDYIVGDFDSVSQEVLDYYKEKGIPIRQFPARKDETDMQLGIALALEKGATDLILLGGLGSRFDHSLANAHLLLGLLKKGIRARLVDENNCVELVNRPITIHGKIGDLVSTIPLSMMVKGITLTGFEYPLINRDLALDDDMVAVSNVLAKEEATIDFTEGYLYVIRSKD
ncbi:MAG: thiamine diphosphokinase [Anaerotignum propionicum]|uniref:thiamine diphosphokinase n=1 Tax=Anaerotignum propionicum TaxID=28446 RepID=UPI002B1F6BEC|nr:thiamine diphosphokinase [Anaerotignum propionicum]MEA5058337.1 thiamine diphosphokinase [Anaerotignum propionicum]